MTAAEIRCRLNELELERLEAHSAGLDRHGPYIADLRQEIHGWRSAFLGAAVTEIAVLRAGLSGALNG